MPHPHEQKLHEVVNSLISESFKSFVAARIAGTSRSPPSASPAPPPRVSLNRSLRLIVGLGGPLPSTKLSERVWIGTSSDSSIGFLRAIADGISSSTVRLFKGFHSGASRLKTREYR